MKPTIFQGYNDAAACARYAIQIRSLRRRCLWNDKQLAQKAGVSDRTYRKAKAGDTSLKADTYRAIIGTLAIYHQLTCEEVAEIIIWCEKARVMI